jgi:hypothetical protein
MNVVDRHNESGLGVKTLILRRTWTCNPIFLNMANDQAGRAEGEEGGGTSWMKTLMNAVAIYFAVNAATSFIAGRLGGQKNATAPDADGIVKPAATSAEQFPALWDLGTKMVL